MHRPLDPRIVNICLDSNALDRVDARRSSEVDRLIAMHDAGAITIVTQRSVMDEVRHPNTPPEVRARIGGGIFTIKTGATAQEQSLLKNLKAALHGNAKPGTHDADATHLAEACKYGIGFFVTHDQRILKREGLLRDLIPPSLQLVTLSEFLSIYDDYAKKYPR